MSKYGIYFDRSILGFSNRIDVYVGSNTDPKCRRVVELAKRMQFDTLVVHNGFHPNAPGECPYILVNENSIGTFRDWRERIGQIATPRVYEPDIPEQPDQPGQS